MIQILLDYLLNYLYEDLVDEKYCSGIDMEFREQTNSQILLIFKNVPSLQKESLVGYYSSIRQADTDKLLFQTLKYFDRPEKFDMERINNIIEDHKRRFRELMEEDPHEFIKMALTMHHLYGSRTFSEQKQQIEDRLQNIRMLNLLKNFDASKWQQPFTETFKQDYVCIQGRPVEKKVDEVNTMEIKRINQQKLRLGEHGIRERGRILQAAITKNNRNRPSKAEYDRFKLNNLNDINLIPVICQQLQNWPVYSITHNVKSNFFEVRIFIDTVNVSAPLRKYLFLWSSLILSADTVVDGQMQNREYILQKKRTEYVQDCINTGLQGSYKRFLRLDIQAEEYFELPAWAKRILDGNHNYDTQQLLSMAKNLSKNAIARKRNGRDVVNFLSNYMVFSNTSNYILGDIIASEQFHNGIVNKLENQQNEFVISQCRSIESAIKKEVINCHFFGNMELMPQNAGSDWEFLRNNPPTRHQYDSIESQTWERWGKVDGIIIGGCQNAQLIKKTQCRHHYAAYETVAAAILCKYFSLNSGVLWNEIRGRGYAYSIQMFVNIDQKIVELHLIDVINLTNAVKKTEETVVSHSVFLLIREIIENPVFKGFFK
uniref:Uncharacterized protein n=1 Tax=Meloidogyne enterolobii TaxID=390850 RepID=A0A6V7X3G8_MELEN|nr:unnamed protein product [Meloidogyne enterolobii]